MYRGRDQYYLIDYHTDEVNDIFVCRYFYMAVVDWIDIILLLASSNFLKVVYKPTCCKLVESTVCSRKFSLFFLTPLIKT